MGGVKNEHYESPVVTVIEMVPETFLALSTEEIRQDDEQGWYQVNY